MYSICSLDKNDVLKSIIAMKQRGYRGPVVQTSKNDYERLRYQKDGVRDFADQLLASSNQQINLLTNTLHIQSCDKINPHRNDVELVRCHIIEPNSTGLKICPCCRSVL